MPAAYINYAREKLFPSFPTRTDQHCWAIKYILKTKCKTKDHYDIRNNYVHVYIYASTVHAYASVSVDGMSRVRKEMFANKLVYSIHVYACNVTDVV